MFYIREIIFTRFPCAKMFCTAKKANYGNSVGKLCSSESKGHLHYVMHLKVEYVIDIWTCATTGGLRASHGRDTNEEYFMLTTVSDHSFHFRLLWTMWVLWKVIKPWILCRQPTGPADDSCTTGDLRLYNVSSPGQGMLQRCNSINQWTAFYSYGWGCKDSIVACRQLGFNDSS